MPQPTYPSQAALYASQPQNGIPVPTPAKLQPAEQQWKRVSRKRGRKTEEQENLNENTQDYWLGELSLPPIDSLTFRRTNGGSR